MAAAAAVEVRQPASGARGAVLTPRQALDALDALLAAPEALLRASPEAAAVARSAAKVRKQAHEGGIPPP